MATIKYRKTSLGFELVEISITEQGICLKAYEDFEPWPQWSTWGGLIAEAEDVMMDKDIDICTDFTVIKVAN